MSNNQQAANESVHAKLRQSIITLLGREPFYAHFVLGCKVKLTDRECPTMGVSVSQGVAQLWINRAYADSLTQTEFTATIKHEMMHLLLDHCNDTGAMSAENRMTVNIAMDLAINQHIVGLDDNGITLDKCEQSLGRKLEPLQTWDYYYAQFQPHVDKLAASGIKPHGDHDKWEPLDAFERAALKQLAHKAARAAAGNVPAYLEKFIAPDGPATLPWKQLLRNIVLSQRITTRKVSYKRINRRFKLPVPGVVKERTFKLGVCVDSSGSVNDKMFTDFFNEIKQLHKMNIDLFIVDADSEVQNAKWVKSGAKFEAKRYGNGGTAYGPALARCDQEQVDMILYFGDMDSADEPLKPRAPVVWVVAGGGEPPVGFGRVLRLAP